MIPYVHKLSHGLKHAGGRYRLGTVFTASNKLAKMRGQVWTRIEGNTADGRYKYVVKRGSQYVARKVAVVYMFSLTCGKKYVGHSGRCVNKRLREHELSLGCNTPSHLATHCRECSCEPVFSDRIILARDRSELNREMIEAFHIRILGSACVSQASIVLSQKGYAYLCTTCTGSGGST